MTSTVSISSNTGISIALIFPCTLFLGIVFFFTVGVFLYECGRFTVAKLLGVPVLSFSVGVGTKPLVTRKFGQTWYFLYPLPFFSRCRLCWRDSVDEAGESVTHTHQQFPLTAEEQVSLRQIGFCPLGARLYLTFLGGPATVMVAVFLLFFASIHWIIPWKGYSPEPVIAFVAPGSTEDKAGFRVGDRVLTVNGEPVVTFDAAAEKIGGKPVQAPVRVEVLREGKTQEIAFLPLARTPTLTLPDGKSVYATLQMRPALQAKETRVLQSLKQALVMTKAMFFEIIPDGLV